MTFALSFLTQIKCNLKVKFKGEENEHNKRKMSKFYAKTYLFSLDIAWSSLENVWLCFFVVVVGLVQTVIKMYIWYVCLIRMEEKRLF